MNDKLLADYQQTSAYWAQLVDVRFKLLALVPALSVAGIGAFGQKATLESAALGTVALLSVVAIAMYDLRNSTYHDLAVHRAKQIEMLMRLPRTTLDWDDDEQSFVQPDGADVGGVFRDREAGRRRLRLFGMQVWHDRALILVYSAAAGGWASVIVRGALEDLDRDPASEWWTEPWLYAAAAVATFVVFFWQLGRFESKRGDDLDPATIDGTEPAAPNPAGPNAGS